MLLPSDIERMSIAERLQAMELLWESISNSGAAVPSPEWHGEVLAARQAKIESGKAAFLSLNQLRERLR